MLLSYQAKKEKIVVNIQELYAITIYSIKEYRIILQVLDKNQVILK